MRQRMDTRRENSQDCQYTWNIKQELIMRVLTMIKHMFRWSRARDCYYLHQQDEENRSLLQSDSSFLCLCVAH